MIKEIQTFQTQDGRLFPRLLDAELHENLLLLKDNVAAFWREHASNDDKMSIRELIDTCVVNVEQLRDALGRSE